VGGALLFVAVVAGVCVARRTWIRAKLRENGLMYDAGGTTSYVGDEYEIMNSGGGGDASPQRAPRGSSFAGSELSSGSGLGARGKTVTNPDIAPSPQRASTTASSSSPSSSPSLAKASRGSLQGRIESSSATSGMWGDDDDDDEEVANPLNNPKSKAKPAPKKAPNLISFGLMDSDEEDGS